MASAGNSSSNIRNINLTGGAKKDENKNNGNNDENNTKDNNAKENEENNTNESNNTTNNTKSNNTNNASNVKEIEIEPMENTNSNTNTNTNTNENDSFVPLEPVSGNMNSNTNTNKSKFNRLSNFTMKNKGNSNSNGYANNGPRMTVEALTKVCEEMMTHHIAMKMFHFQTDSYAAHKASDTYITAFLAFHDMFMETAQGIYGKMSCEKHNCTTMLFSSTSDCIKHIDEYRMKMKELRTKVSDQPDLVNMVDGQLQTMNQLKYLLTFK